MKVGRFCFLAAAILTAALFSGLSSSPALAAWSGASGDIQIGFDNNEYAQYLRIAVDPADAIHVVWSEDVPSYDEILYGRSTDGGATWSCSVADQVISYNDAEGVQDSCDIAIDSQGRLFVVWSEDEPNAGNNEILLSYSTDGGTTWSAPTAGDVVISDPVNESNTFYPAIAADPDDTLHVVFHKNDPAVGFSKIYTTRSTDNGATWTAVTGGDQMINDTASAYSDHSADIDCDQATGDLYACYLKYLGTGAGYQIHVTRSTDGGLTWSGTTAETPVSMVWNIASAPRVAVDSNGIVHVIWYASDETASPYHYEIAYSRSTDGGATWSGTSANTVVSYENVAGDSAFNCKLAADSCGNVCVAWDEDPMTGGGTNEIMVSCSTDGGATWSGAAADELISYPDGENAYRPDLKTTSDGTWFAVWSEFNGTTTDNYEVHLSVGDPLCTYDTLDCSYTIAPTSGTVPFATQHTVTMTNLYLDQSREMAGRIDVLLANGLFFSNWRSGFSNLGPGATFSTTWSLTMPAEYAVIGDNLAMLYTQDVTPSPYNQPPYPPAGDTCTVTNTVTAYQP